MFEKSSQHWTDPDLKAFATYLLTVYGIESTVAAPALADNKSMVVGRAIYPDRRAACHVGSGEAVAPSRFRRADSTDNSILWLEPER